MTKYVGIGVPSRRLTEDERRLIVGIIVDLELGGVFKRGELSFEEMVRRLETIGEYDFREAMEMIRAAREQPKMLETVEFQRLIWVKLNGVRHGGASKKRRMIEES